MKADHVELGGFERRLLEELTARDAARPVSAPTGPRPVRRWRRPAVLVGAAGVAVIVGGAAAAASALWNQHDLAVATTSVYPGGPLYLKGAGCADGAAVQIRLDGADLGTVRAQDGGLFAADLVLPPETATGEHTITASCGDGAAESVQRMTILVIPRVPEPPLPPDFAIGGSAVPHGEFLVKGAGCRPGAIVSFRIAARAADVGSARADEGGAYTAVLTVPDLPLGVHSVVASCAARDGTELALTGSLEIIDPATAGETGPKPTT